MTINGKAADSNSSFDVVNPATGQVAAQAPECSAEQLEAAMSAAGQAQKHWGTEKVDRSEVIRKLAAEILNHAEELTALLQQETGKPTALAAAEPAICAAWLEYYASVDLPQRELLLDDDSARVELTRHPVGVVAAITPWNFPLSLSLWKIAPALRAGNAVVIKPSPFAPLAALRLGQIMGDVLPAGVVNTISGGDALGAAMVSHPLPRKVTFTGSVAAGKSVAAASAGDLKRVTLELGGNDAAIILDDADVASTVAHLLPLAFLNSGQACAIPKRIFAPEKLYDDVVAAFAAGAAGMRVGEPADPTTHLGPLSTRPQFDRVGELVDAAIQGGAHVAAGGHRIDTPGYFFEPTILADLEDGSRVVAEEQFGPALPILKYRDIDSAVDRANDTAFGLCGSVWSTDADRAAVVAEKLHVGTAFINTHAVAHPAVPFGGLKDSGLGLENGLAGLLSFTDPQVVHRVKA